MFSESLAVNESACMTLSEQSHSKNLFLMVLLWTVVVFNYYLINMDAKHFSGGIYRNSMAIALSSMLACIVTLFLLSFLTTRKFMMIYFWLAAVFGTAHILIRNEDVTIGLTFMTAFVVYSNYTTALYAIYEYFPPTILGLVLGTA